MGSYVGVVRICRTCAKPQAVNEFRAHRARCVVRRICLPCERARWRRWRCVLKGLPLNPEDLPPKLTTADFERIAVYEARERNGEES